MKIAIYTQNMNNTEYFDSLNNSKARSKCMFFDTVGPKPKDHDFGLFSSTEILNYTGPLIVDFIEGVKFASNSCNTKYPIYYLYNNKDQDLIGLMGLTLNSRVIICYKPQDEKEVVRKIGKGIGLPVKDIDDLITTALKHD